MKNQVFELLMKKIVLLFLLALPVQIFAKGISFFEGTFEEAKAKARKENKIIFVDFFAVWCGPCKFMSNNVFTDSLVADYYNRHFVAVKIDAEKVEAELVKRVGVEAYPTLAFFKPDGTLFYKLKGGMDIPNFMKLGKQIAEFEKNKTAWERNRNNIPAMTSYLLVLQQNDPEKANKIAADYLKNVPRDQILTPENWSLALTFERDYESEIFLHTVDNFLFYMDSVPGYQEYFTAVTNKLMEDAVAKKDTALLNRYKKYASVAMTSSGQEFPTSFRYEIDIYFYSKTGNLEMQLKKMDELLMYYTGTVQPIINNTYDLLEQVEIQVLYPYAKRWAEKAMIIEKSSSTWMLYAYVSREAGNREEALSFANEALKMAGEEDDTDYIRDFIDETSK